MTEQQQDADTITVPAEAILAATREQLADALQRAAVYQGLAGELQRQLGELRKLVADAADELDQRDQQLAELRAQVDELGRKRRRPGADTPAAAAAAGGELAP